MNFESPTRVLSLVGLFSLSTSALHSQWIQQSFPTNELLEKVRFVDSLNGWVIAENHLYKTTDGGMIWDSKLPLTNGGYALCAPNQNIVLCSSNTLTYPFYDALRKTTDGGGSWQTIDSGKGYRYFKFQFLDADTGFVAGSAVSPSQIDTPIVRKTTDAGLTWHTIFTVSNAGDDMMGISFIDGQTAWAVTYFGLMYHTTDGGQSWDFQDSVGRASPDHYVPVRDVQFTTRDSGWAVGGITGSNVIARTIDGGATWSFLSPGGGSLREIAMLNSHVGWFVGSINFPPFIARTTNAGESWVQQYTVPMTTTGLESISMLTENYGWAVGEQGIYRTINGGVTGIDETSYQPMRSFLEQNYPNPFNPSTTIKFELPRTSHVNLSVYDVLGRQVSVLVNERTNAGVYEVKFDASGLASGVYFYRLIAGSFTQTKKLLLLR